MTEETPSAAVTDYIAGLAERARSRLGQSRTYRIRYHRSMADSRIAAGFRPATKELQFPLVGTRASGATIWDADGLEYTDLAMGFGVQLFGHDPAFVREAVAGQMQRGLHLGPQSHLAGPVAERLCELTNNDRACFCSTGTEAVMTALRLARAHTSRDNIAMFKWSYHGHHEATLGRPQMRNGEVRSIPLAPGIPQSAVEGLLMLDYGDEACFQQLDDHRQELAAIIVEPVQSLRPNLDVGPFLHKLRAWASHHGVVLIFDEILTGFRLHLGGAQALFGVTADVTTYGKIIGGGFPIGVVAGKAEILSYIDGGYWHDNQNPSSKRTFFAGTFNKNPLSMAVAAAVLQELQRQGPQLQAELNRKTGLLAGRLNDLFHRLAAPIQVIAAGSIFRFLSKRPLDLFYYRLLLSGVYIWEGRSCFLSTAHGDQQIEHVVSAADETIREMQSAGVL